MIILDPLIRIVIVALDIYVWAVIISAILTWLVHFGVLNTSNQIVSMIGEFLWRITEPAIRPIRRFMPNLGGIDISPIILILVIYFAQMVLGNILVALHTGL
ncbi:YggT family protein [Pelagibius litoralis]|uniref:YggT family protein n=1 Tax=Pelagibius litoralis TaxID=374515 RepID=UPI00197CCF77|nr:YggT family protein [Pelagibius litoralis]